MNETTSLILASASPRRRELLAVFGLSFSVQPADIDESRLGDETAAGHVQRIAMAKAAAIALDQPEAFVIGSDTAVIVDGESLGKPADALEARAMLQRLSGRSHEVMSAVAVICPDGRRLDRISVTTVDFAPLPDHWMTEYIASGDPMDKAGGYGIQNQAGIWIRRIDGSYTGVVGLPLYETGELLREAGLI
jgi:septum formation protein